jgi:plasmid maintenance system killer protein
MSVDPLEDAIRPVVQKLITESVKSPDSVTLKVYDDALDRIEKYLKRILIVCAAFLTVIGSILGFVGWSSITQIKTDFEHTAKSKLSEIQSSNDKVLAKIETQRRAVEAEAANLSKHRIDLENQWKEMVHWDGKLRDKVQVYIEQVRLVTTEISPEQQSHFDADMKAFWDYGRKIGLFEHPLTQVQVVRAFTVERGADFLVSDNEGLLKVAIVFITSEPNLLHQLIIDRLGELNDQVKQLRARVIAEIENPQAESKSNQQLIGAINAISRALGQYIADDYLTRSVAGSSPYQNARDLNIAQNPDEFAAQWVAVFREYDRRVRLRPGLGSYSAAAALMRVWKDLGADAAVEINPATLIRRVARSAAQLDSHNANALTGVGEELANYYDASRPSLASSAAAPTGDH